MCLGMFILKFIMYKTLCTSWILVAISISRVRQVFTYNFFKYFLRHFLFLYFSGTSIIQVLECLMLSQMYLRLFSFFSFLFLSFCPTEGVSTFVFQLTYPFFCFSFSDIDFFLMYFSFQLFSCSSLFVLLLL